MSFEPRPLGRTGLMVGALGIELTQMRRIGDLVYGKKRA